MDQTIAVTDHRFTLKIILGMCLGVVVGLLLHWVPMSAGLKHFLAEDVFHLGGALFLRLIRLLVVPIVLVSLVCGSSSLGDLRKVGRMGGKTLLLYLLTTAIAVATALWVAGLFHVGEGLHLPLPTHFELQKAPSLENVLLNIVSTNPFDAMAKGNMLQIIVFALLFGVAVGMSGEAGKKISALFEAVNVILMKLIILIMKTAPYGVFCLLAALFSQLGFSAIGEMLAYFLVVLLVLAIQLFACYGVLLTILGRLNPIIFFKKMYATMLFAFSISSSSAAIPVVLRTVENRLGVKNAVASFIIPLGATINMDGTAVMQGVATVFIAGAYHLHLGVMGYLTVIAMATLASVGTAGVPGVGLITLAMVLQQVKLPVEGIALIMGVDRLLDMARTAVNVSGDSMVACLVGRSEKEFNQARYDDKSR